MTTAVASFQQQHGQQQNKPAFTCITCHAMFSDADTQRFHYRSDWHRINLSRKVQELPPLSEAVFSLQAANNQGDSGSIKETSKKTFSTARKACSVCRKSFSSEKAMVNHAKSTGHITAEVEILLNGSSRKKANALDEEEGQVIALDSVKPGTCFLCVQQRELESREALLEHLLADHHLFIPDREHLSDAAGLVEYLQAKVLLWNACLTCHDFRLFLSESGEEGDGFDAEVSAAADLEAAKTLFKSGGAVIRHMHDKGHCKIRFDEVGQEELARFYDYSGKSSTMSAARMLKSSEDIVYVSGSEYEDNSEFEDVSEGEAANSNDYQSIASNFDDSRIAWISPDEIEMILPSGRRIGNRQYLRYYRQNLAPYNTEKIFEENQPRAYLESRSPFLCSQVAARSVSSISDSTVAVSGFRQARIPTGHMKFLAIRYSDRLLERNRQARVLQRQARSATIAKALKSGVNINSLQKHFREQIL